jgi:hypothetical protein
MCAEGQNGGGKRSICASSTTLKPERIKSMANFSDADKRPTDGDNRKKAGSPDPKRKSGTMLDKDELPEPEAGKIVGGVMGDPCAGGQYRGR